MTLQELLPHKGLQTIILIFFFFFFNDTATTEIYTLSLHDALPICRCVVVHEATRFSGYGAELVATVRSEEHTSELQSQSNLVCRLLLEKKKIQATSTLDVIRVRIRYIRCEVGLSSIVLAIALLMSL